MSDQITLTIPREPEFHRVAHLVLSGLALRLDLTIETLEDFQIALDTVLDFAEHDDDVTVTLTAGEGVLEVRVGPVLVREALAQPGDGELNLRRVLSTVVDDVEVDGDWVRLTKRVRGDG